MTRGPVLLAALFAALTLGAVISASNVKDTLAQAGAPSGQVNDRELANRGVAASIGEQPFSRWPDPVLKESTPPLDIVNDEFQSTTLDPAWRFSGNPPKQWSVGGSPGALKITTEDGDLYADFNDAKGVLLRQIPAIAYDFRTKVTIAPTANGQQAGLIQFFDQDTYLKLVRTRNSNRSPQAQDYIEMTYEVNGVARELNIITTTETTVYLRIQRNAGFALGQWSTDGFNWKLVAGYNDIVIQGYKVGLYAVSGSGNPGPGVVASFDNFRVDDIRGQAFDRFGVQSPSVLRDTDGTYKMWFTGQGDGDLNALNRIGYATSSDGVSWQKLSANPVITGEIFPNRDKGVSDATVIKEGGVYKMWYSGYVLSGTTRAGDIYYATSSDGISWQRLNIVGGILIPVLPVGAAGDFDDLEVRAGSVIKNGSAYLMWYGARSKSGQGSIGLATSSDGITWSKSPQNPVIANGQSPRGIIMEGSSFRLYYTSINKILTALSADGSTWTPGATTILAPGDENTWDIERVRDPWALQEGGVIRLWYTGGSIPRIGRASSPLAVVQSIFAPVISFGKVLLAP